jgi:prepilin-type processing-associated H-X9-DG protein
MLFRRRLTSVEMLVLVASAAALVILALPAIGRAGEAARRLGCQSNLKMWSTAFRMYAGESNGGCLPAMTVRTPSDASAASDWLASPDGTWIYPDYLDDLTAYFCPADEANDFDKFIGQPEGLWRDEDGQLDPSRFDNRSYFYDGFAAEDVNVHMTLVADARFLEAVTPFTTPADYIAFAKNTIVLEGIDDPRVLQDAVIDPLIKSFGGQVPGAAGIRAQGNCGMTRIFRLRDGIERFFITDISATSVAERARTKIPVMWDVMDLRSRAFVHTPPGINVLYIDGHVNFVRYPHNYPATQAVAILGRGIG